MALISGDNGKARLNIIREVSIFWANLLHSGLSGVSLLVLLEPVIPYTAYYE